MTILRRSLAALLLVLLIYVAAGLIGGAIPRNGGWRAPANGVVVYIEDNGIHTGLVVPKVAAGIDWRGVTPATDIADPRYAAFDHVAFSWGEQGFFLNTPTWADVRPSTIAAAAIGSDHTLIHVEHLPRPTTGSDVRAVTLSAADYRRLAAFIAASIVPKGERHRGYAHNDVFYQSNGRYDAFRTCNDWTGKALRTAGVRMGAWTPFPITVMWWLPRGTPEKP